ncbi:hypothetical protein I553_0363 [Mycobacterium xenopi 4042]|uniref:Uncharacterized protein n=1 Tax=Mycobacterium xenopi 4042 TaxID=1299334 RepID=X7YL63_MYCXE|nr:hypothetical protein I553_0363 [Mycobacterium xenopi 4042]
MERGGRSLLTFTDDPDAQHAAAAALADLVAPGASTRSWSSGSTACRCWSCGSRRFTRRCPPPASPVPARAATAVMPEGDTVFRTAATLRRALAAAR